VGEAFPEHYYSQTDVVEALKRLWRDRDVDTATLERLHRHAGVDGRHFVLPLEAYDRPAAWGQTNNTWIRHAEELGATAVMDALDRAGCPVSEVGALVFVSVTGISTPSVDAKLINRLGLPASIRRVPLFGLGCVAGASGLARGAELAQARPGGAVVVLSVELCSLTFQYDDLTVANIIAAGIFGDGAAAVVLSGNGAGADGPSIVATRSVFYPDTEEMMGWEISEKGFQLVLSREVPHLIHQNLGRDVDQFLSEEGLGRADIDRWMAHSGGPKILRSIQEALDLPDGALDVTWDSLRRVGNISSASVLHVLKNTLEGSRPDEGSYGLLFAMGPGFCCELVLLRW